MTTRSHTEMLAFDTPFRLKGVERLLPAGSYEVLIDEETIEELSFPCFRRVSTIIKVPGEWPFASAIEMITTSAVELSDAQRSGKAASGD